MRTLLCVLLVIVLVFRGVAAAAQSPTFTVTQLTKHLYLLTTDQGSYTTNTLASVGDDGVLLVDTQSKDVAEELKSVVDAFGKGLPKYIINTHRHVEHVGGNAIFGSAPVVIAHALVRHKLRSGSFLFEEFPDATLPDVTLTDSLNIHFNGERITVHALTGAHDDNEIIVHFTDSKVVHLSSLVNGFTFPSVDADGDVLAFARLVERAMELLPQDVVIVSGHNEPGSWSDLRSYRDMLTTTTALVRNGLAQGKNVTTLQEEEVLADWESYGASYVSVNGWIEYLAEGLERRVDNRSTVFEPLYYKWRDEGAEAAVEYYFALKRDRSSEYRFGETTLLAIGTKLLSNGHVQAAVTFLEASLQDYPESRYGYYVNYKLAQAHDELGNTERAIVHCERALALNSEYGAAAALLERLKRKG
jgi:glyoxylase-like metal-dependent hydrolase (beta-lactamase superfamily II)